MLRLCSGKLVVLLPVWLSACVFVLSLCGDKLVLSSCTPVRRPACGCGGACTSLCVWLKKKKEQVCIVLCLCGSKIVCLISNKKKISKERKIKVFFFSFFTPVGQ